MTTGVQVNVSMDIEVWRPVQGYTGYECSNYGRVRKTGAGVDLRIVSGYGMRRVTLRKGDDFVLVVVADIILTAFVCPKPAGMKAYVIDGNYENLALPNLIWVKRKRDKYERRSKAKKKQQQPSAQAQWLLKRINEFNNGRNNSKPNR